MRKIYKTLKAAAENPESVVDHGKLYAEAAESYKLLYKEMSNAVDYQQKQSMKLASLRETAYEMQSCFQIELEWHTLPLDLEPYTEGWMWASSRHKRLVDQLQRLATIASVNEICEEGASKTFEAAAGYLRRLYDLSYPSDEHDMQFWPMDRDDPDWSEHGDPTILPNWNWWESI